jgi:hypothetical protein
MVKAFESLDTVVRRAPTSSPRVGEVAGQEDQWFEAEASDRPGTTLDPIQGARFPVPFSA